MSGRIKPLFVVSLVSSVLASAVAFGQTTAATACIGDDLADLTAAAEKETDNIGLLMRLAMKKLALVRGADSKEMRALVTDVDRHLTQMKELGADFPYPYRALAKGQYKRELYAECLSTVDAYRGRDDLDYELNTLYFRALLRLATRTVDPEPKRSKEAAEYIASWFDSGSAPPFGTTLGALRAWVVDPTIRADLLSAFAARHAKTPDNLNLVISYVACLAAVGRYETAWRLVQEAERNGLCDAATGSRHAVTYLLAISCPEETTPESYDGYDINELKDLATRFPKNASFQFRVAALIKSKANTASRVALLYGERIKRILKDNPNADVVALQAKQAGSHAEAKKGYEEALPYALKVNASHPDIDTLPLLLGDIYYKLERFDEAAIELERGLAKVPTFADLRDALAFVCKEREDWPGMIRQLVEACKRAPCETVVWDKNPQDSLLPKPKSVREKMIVELVERSDTRAMVIDMFTAAAKQDGKNPNLQAFVAMAHFFAGNKNEAVAAMRQAEMRGLCGREGFEHELATLINARKNW